MRNSPKHRRGLTLLELLIVVLIMAAVAGAAVSLTDNLDSQIRYDDTTSRLDTIRYGILGDVRPQPDGRQLLSGFVVDVGRLPSSLDELILSYDELIAKYGAAYGTLHAAFTRQDPVFYDPTPTDVSNGDEKRLSSYLTTTILPAWWKGCRGPYVQSGVWQKRSDTGIQQKRFRDGWGTRAVDPTEDDNDANHGWFVKWSLTGTNSWTTSYPISSYPSTLSPDVMTVRSYGSDGLFGVNSTDRYAEDVPPPPNAAVTDTRTNDPPWVKPEDWTVSASTFTIDVRATTGTISNVQVAWLYYQDPMTTQWPWIRIDSVDNGAQGQTVDAAGKSFTFDPTDLLPIGPQLLVVFTDTDSVFDNVTLKSVKLVDVFPRNSSTSYQVTIAP